MTHPFLLIVSRIAYILFHPEVEYVGPSGASHIYRVRFPDGTTVVEDYPLKLSAADLERVGLQIQNMLLDRVLRGVSTL